MTRVGNWMPTIVHNVLASIALVAFLGGMVRVQPCLDDDECAMACSSNLTMTCHASGEHHDPVAPIDSCNCMCHVPSVTMSSPAVCRPNSPMELGMAPVDTCLSLCFLENPFHPPRV